jgi:hypothetical protein
MNVYIFSTYHCLLSKIDASDRKMITDAMDMLMFDVGTPIPNSEQRSACVYFRPYQLTDPIHLKIQYGEGCSATVSNVIFNSTLRDVLDWFFHTI